MGETDESGRDLDYQLTNVFNLTGCHRVRRKFGCWDKVVLLPVLLVVL